MNYPRLIGEMIEVNRKKGTIPFELAERMAVELQTLGMALTVAATKLEMHCPENQRPWTTPELYDLGKALCAEADHAFSNQDKQERTDKIDWITARNQEQATLTHVVGASGADIGVAFDYNKQEPLGEPANESYAKAVKQLKSKSRRTNARALSIARADRPTDS